MTAKKALAEEKEDTHFKKIHSADLGDYSVTEILDRDTAQRYLAFERKGEITVIHKEPPVIRPIEQCIDGSTGKLCGNPLIKDPYSMKSFFVPVEQEPKAAKQESEKPKE